MGSGQTSVLGGLGKEGEGGKSGEGRGKERGGEGEGGVRDRYRPGSRLGVQGGVVRGSTVFREVFGNRGSPLMNYRKDELNWEDNVRLKLEDLEPSDVRVSVIRKKRTQILSDEIKLQMKYEQGHWSKKNPKNSVEFGGSGESVGFGVVTDANLGDKIRKKLSIDRNGLLSGQQLTMKLMNAIEHSRLVDCQKDPRKPDDIKYISLKDGPVLKSRVDPR